MATPQLSPGVITREVDLTVGRAENVLDNIGAIAAPFAIGPVDEVVNIETENQLINTFGKPISTDAHYEYWMTASSFLSYGGVLKVVRTDGSTLNNANSGVSTSPKTLKITNYDDYTLNHSTEETWSWAAKNPGSWANNLKVCVIDDAADQILGVTTTSLAGAGATVGYGVTAAISGTLPGSGTTSSFTGYLKGIITGVSTDSTSGASTINVKIVSRVETSGAGSTETAIDYAEGNALNSFTTSSSLYFVNNSGINTGLSAVTPYTPATAVDWYNQQTLGLTNSTVYWKSIAPKPGTSSYASGRSAKNDEIHVAIYDDNGSVTGIQGNLLEKHLGLSKASDAVSAVDSPTKIYWKDYIAGQSAYVYAGDNPSVGIDTTSGTSPLATGFSANFTAVTEANGSWGQLAQGVTFGAIGKATYTLSGGVDYSASNGMAAALGDLVTSYNLFSNKDEVAVDYLLMGPGLTVKAESQAKANKLISIANERKDCMAVVSPHRADVVNITSTATQLTNVTEFFSPLQSSSYAVFDSGYKYMYDRFNNAFRYVPCNGDVAGLMVRTSIVAFPWFSPAGQNRGVLNNAIKLAFNPSKAQRDELYSLRINSIINQPGAGILLFGDKTALTSPSSFDRINVRRLFLTIEQALETTAQAQLFELNDEITRSNFVNIVEPYLRDVQAKRGLYDFLVICDETNNTPEVVDNNEFRADIFIKPARSINYITLTFVATRTGVSFDEVAGRV